MKKFSVLLALMATCQSCQKPPKASLAIDPWASQAPSPMGSSVHNDKLKEELLVFDELMKKDKGIGEIDKNWLLAKHLFSRRRFIESSTLLASLLKERPNFNEARNYFARSLFFLGNPFKALSELKIILESNPSYEEKLDALYLTGAFVFELDDANDDLLKEGISSWQAYLKNESLNKSLTHEVKKGLNELLARKNTVLKKSDPKAESLLLEARSLIQQGKVKEALNAFFSLTKQFPQFAPGFHYQGMAFMMNGDANKAVLSWQKVINLDPVYAKNFNLLDRIKIAQSLPNKIESH